MARSLWAFDFESEGPPLDWTKLKTYIIVQKKPVVMRIKIEAWCVGMAWDTWDTEMMDYYSRSKSTL